MADRSRNQHGLGKSVTFNVITPMNPLTTWVVRFWLWFFSTFRTTQRTAERLSFLPFVQWVVVSRRRFPRADPSQLPERLSYDYLLFLSTFSGPWGPYIDAFADVLHGALDLVWFWSIGYPGARPVTPLKSYIIRNQVESDHHYSAYPGASVRDVRSALRLHDELKTFAAHAHMLEAQQFAEEFNRVLLRVQNCLGAVGTVPAPSDRPFTQAAAKSFSDVIPLPREREHVGDEPGRRTSA